MELAGAGGLGTRKAVEQHMALVVARVVRMVLVVTPTLRRLELAPAPRQQDGGTPPTPAAATGAMAHSLPRITTQYEAKYHHKTIYDQITGPENGGSRKVGKVSQLAIASLDCLPDRYPAPPTDPDQARGIKATVRHSGHGILCRPRAQEQRHEQHRKLNRLPLVDTFASKPPVPNANT
jgi:hypothetical protein